MYYVEMLRCKDNYNICNIAYKKLLIDDIIVGKGVNKKISR